MPPALDHLLTASETARRIRRSSVRVNQLTQAGELPSISTPLGRLYDPDDVAAYLARRDGPDQPDEAA